jgi:hypothetical protein
MEDDKVTYEVIRRWKVKASSPAEAAELAKPGENIDVIIHRHEDEPEDIREPWPKNAYGGNSPKL